MDTVITMTRKQSNPCWPASLTGTIRTYSGYNRNNHGLTVYRLSGNGDVISLSTGREYRTIAGCIAAHAKLGWIVNQ